MDQIDFIAINSKKQTMFLLIPAILLILSSILFSIFNILSEDIFFYNFVVLSASSILIISSINFLLQPKIAIEIYDNTINFYKRNSVFSYNINEIKKIKINTNSGSFDTTIYTIDGSKNTFHFLLIQSSKKKTEYIEYFKKVGIKVIEFTID